MAQNNNKEEKLGKVGSANSGGLLKDLMDMTLRKKQQQQQGKNLGSKKGSRKGSKKGKKSRMDGSERKDLTKKNKQPCKIGAIEDEEKEVFENVADSNPVFSKNLLRPGKMKWKGDDEKDQETLRKKKDESEQTEIKNKKKNDSKTGDLLVKIEKLEKENEDLKKKLKDVQSVLKSRRPEEGNHELKEVVCSKCKSNTKTNESEKSEEENVKTAKRTINQSISNKPDEHHKLAYNVLTIMKKNQVLDAVLDFKSNKLLFSFFRESNNGDKPSEEIANLVELAMSRGLKYLINCCDQIDDVIDNDLRSFICSPVAKKILLKALFENPELVPDMWGGGPILIKKRKDDAH